MIPIPRAAPAHRPRIIVVTTCPRLALRTQLALLAAGHAVEVATSLRRGFAILCQRPPDGMVLDGAVRTWHPADYNSLVAAAHDAQVALMVLGEADAEPALVAPEVGGRTPASVPPSLLGVVLAERLSARDLCTEAASGLAPDAGG
jgi:hypothetical protein